MRDFLIKRTVQAVGVILAISAITFFVLNIVPGDPVRIMLGELASEEALETVRHRMGLDQPIYMQYFSWLTKMMRGDFGESYFQHAPVLQLLMKALSVTAVLAGWSYLFALVLGVTIGVVAAVNHGNAIDRALMSFAVLGISAPAFWVALLLQIVFALKLHWLPLSGTKTAASFVLPVIALGSRYFASISRVTRTAMLEVLSQDYMRTAEPLIEGGVMYIAFICVVVYLVVDILYAVVDPRIRLGGGDE